MDREGGGGKYTRSKRREHERKNLFQNQSGTEKVVIRHVGGQGEKFGLGGPVLTRRPLNLEVGEDFVD